VLVNQPRVLRFALISLLLAGVLLAMAAFSTTADAIEWVDEKWYDLMSSIRFTPAVWLAEAMAFIGSVWVNWPLRVAALIFLAAKRRWLQLVAFAFAILTSEILIGALKAAYARPRPPDGLIATNGFSFPSGHATLSMVAYGTLAILVSRSRLPVQVRILFMGLAGVVVFLVGLSRIWLGAHYPSDVVAGWTTGAVVVLVFATVTRGVSMEPAAVAVDEDPAAPRPDPPAAV
jgi:undecaprenyl-diphosphatase